MSDHSIVIDMEAPQFGHFECEAADNSPCKAQWGCECEAIWNYRTIGGSPVHDSTAEGEGGFGNAIHVGYFNNAECNLSDWYDNQDECVDGTIRVDVSPVNEIDYVAFTATSARMEARR